MTSDEKRTALLHEIAAWRETRDECEPDSPQHKEFQKKKVEAEWKLQALGPSQEAPGLVIEVVDPKKPQE
jgi:hypothetical protein